MSELLRRDRRCVWHPYTQHATEADPLPVVAARGARLVLEDGRELIDAISSWWAILHGHGDQRLIEVAQRQWRTLDHVLFAGATHAPAVELAEALLEVVPRGLSRVFFTDDGSTAVEAALKMVLQRWVHEGQPARRVFIALEGGYHGDTFGAMSVGDPDPFFQPFAPLLFEVRRIAPTRAALEAALDELGARAAGAIVEPLVQGAAGMRMYDAAFLRDLASMCQARGLPWIADEVFTGFGRTGSLFACQRAGVAPDLMCLGKGLTGGLFPMAVTLAREEIFADFLSSDRGRAFFHGHTFTAHPVGCAIAKASLAIVLQEDLPARFERLGSRLAEQLTALGDDSRTSEPRRTGGIVAFDLGASAPQGYLSSVAPALRRAAVERGVLLRPLGNVIYAVPPACTSDDELRVIARVMRELVDICCELSNQRTGCSG